MSYKILDRLHQEMAAIIIACDVHASQVDKGGKPYIQHPIRLMKQFSDELDRVVAVLHDVLEDGPEWTAQRMLDEGISPEAVRIVQILTRRKGENYEGFILRVVTDPVAVRVKLADLRDNMDLSRIAEPTANDHRRTEKYAAAVEVLKRANAWWAG